MIKNYVKTALRSLGRRKVQSFIHVAGLSVGFAAFLLIFLVVRYEQSYDQFHVNKDNLYRVVRIPRNLDETGYRTGVPVPVTEALRSNYPQVANVSSIMPDGDVQVNVGDKKNGTFQKYSLKKGMFFAQPQFFDMFSYPLVAGEYASSLSMPGNVLLTQSLANTYFGQWQNALGRSLTMDGIPVKVTGILKDPPDNTDMPIKAVVSYLSLKNFMDFTSWGNISDENYCWIQLKPGDSPEAFNRLLYQFTEKHIKPVNKAYFLALQPLSEMHFDAKYGNYNGHVFSHDLIFALMVIGVFLLVIACVNFINLSTAQAVNRAKEVGVRKVLGGNRGQLIFQFLSEAAVITCIALCIALIAANFGRSWVNNLMEIHLTRAALFQGNMPLIIAGSLVSVIVLAGFYPAFLLSGFNAVRVMKGALPVQHGSGISLRRGLVVFQFVTAQILIIATLVVASQMSFFQKANLGFNKEAIVMSDMPGDSLGLANRDAVRNELMRIPGVENLSMGNGGLVFGGWYTGLNTPDNHTNEPTLVTGIKLADSSMFSLLQMHFVAGRPYYNSDTPREFVVNETVAHKLGYKDPQLLVGKMLRINGWLRPVVGVVRDFHSASLKDSIYPVAMTSAKRSYGTVSVKFNLSDTKEVVASMHRIWDKYFPDFIFSSTFLDQQIAQYYEQETQLAKLYKLFAAMAIFISCLGLYGLISFMALQRRKEIGVRKVLGAPVSSILMLLSREFTLLIGIAFLIAAPVAWYFMHQWLQQYVYRISLGAGVFVATMLGSILIAWATVAYTAIKAASANPVKSLRTE
jgi:putative ABC transport system permease protein